MQFRPNQKINHARLVELLAAGASRLQCAEEFGCSHTSIFNYTRRHGLKVRIANYRRLTPEQKKDIIKMVEKGIPVKYVAEIYRYTYSSLVVRLFRWGVRSRWGVTGARKDGTYGPPVSNQEIVDNWRSVFSWLQKRYRYATVDELTDAVNAGSIELRRIPRPSEWFAVWCGIAGRRCVDLLRERSTLGRAAKGQRVEYDDVIRRQVEPEIDNKEMLEKLIMQLPKRLQKIIAAKLSHESNPWGKLRIPQSTYYRLLNEAYELMRASIA